MGQLTEPRAVQVNTVRETSRFFLMNTAVLSNCRYLITPGQLNGRKIRTITLQYPSVRSRKRLDSGERGEGGIGNC